MSSPINGEDRVIEACQLISPDFTASHSTCQRHLPSPIISHSPVCILPMPRRLHIYALHGSGTGIELWISTGETAAGLVGWPIAEGERKIEAWENDSNCQLDRDFSCYLGDDHSYSSPPPSHFSLLRPPVVPARRRLSLAFQVASARC